MEGYRQKDKSVTHRENLLSKNTINNCRKAGMCGRVKVSNRQKSLTNG